MNHPRPLKQFGQNYLVDKNITRKIVAAFDPRETDFIIEIGPGRGILTSELLNVIPSVNAIEIDYRVIEELKSSFPSANFINADFLDIDLKSLAPSGGKIRIIGNIPYNITSPIIFKLIESRDLVKDAVLMVQYEVAKRFNAGKDTKDYGIMSVLLDYFTSTEFLFKVSPNVFFPKPKVDSAVVKINFDKTTAAGLPDKLFIDTVKAAFGNRRKTLKNSLGNSKFKDIDFEKSGIDLTKRAENLSTADYIILAEFILKSKGNKD